MEEGEEGAWRKVKREWMGWKEEWMGRIKVWERRDGGRGKDGKGEGIREDGIVMRGRSNDDGEAGS